MSFSTIIDVAAQLWQINIPISFINTRPQKKSNVTLKVISRIWPQKVFSRSPARYTGPRITEKGFQTFFANICNPEKDKKKKKIYIYNHLGNAILKGTTICLGAKMLSSVIVPRNLSYDLSLFISCNTRLCKMRRI